MTLDRQRMIGCEGRKGILCVHKYKLQFERTSPKEGNRSIDHSTEPNQSIDRSRETRVPIDLKKHSQKTRIS